MSILPPPQPVCLQDPRAGGTWERKERWVGGESRGAIREGVLQEEVEEWRRYRREAGWGSWHHPGLLPQLPVLGPGRGRDQNDNRVGGGRLERQIGAEVAEEEGSLGKQKEGQA